MKTQTQKLAAQAAHARLDNILHHTNNPLIIVPSELRDTCARAMDGLRGLSFLLNDAGGPLDTAEVHASGVAYLLELIVEDIGQAMPQANDEAYFEEMLEDEKGIAKRAEARDRIITSVSKEV